MDNSATIITNVETPDSKNVEQPVTAEVVVQPEVVPEPEKAASTAEDQTKNEADEEAAAVVEVRADSPDDTIEEKDETPMDVDKKEEAKDEVIVVPMEEEKVAESEPVKEESVPSSKPTPSLTPVPTPTPTSEPLEELENVKATTGNVAEVVPASSSSSSEEELKVPEPEVKVEAAAETPAASEAEESTGALDATAIEPPADSSSSSSSSSSDSAVCADETAAEPDDTAAPPTEATSSETNSEDVVQVY